MIGSRAAAGTTVMAAARSSIKGNGSSRFIPNSKRRRLLNNPVSRDQHRGLLRQHDRAGASAD
jgi:hypothetical protein